MHTIIEFDTDRLRLRQWCMADREPFALLNANRKDMEYFPSLLDRAASDALSDYCQSLIQEKGWGFWAVEIRENQEFIGFVGLNSPSYTLPFSPCIEIGWRLAYQHWGKGYATEAAKGALQVGFEKLDLPDIVSFTAVMNHRSRAVMERLKMRKDASTFEHPKVPVGNKLREHYLYRLSQEQWLTHTKA